MLGRTEDKIKYEKKIQEKICNMPPFITSYYYSLNEKTYMTKSKYINQVIRFLNYISDNNISSITEDKLNAITEESIQKYIMDIQFADGKREMSPEAKAQIYCSLNSFLTFLNKKGMIDDNPFKDGIQRPKTKEHDITFLEPEEYEIVKRNIMSGVGNARSKGKQRDWINRDLLLFQLPIITGVRVTALSQIAYDDIDLDKRLIRVIDKNRDKKLYMDNETYNIMLNWLGDREELMQGYKECPYLFISNRRDKMTSVSIGNVIKKYTYNIDKHITPHKLRSTCGTNMYRATHDIYLVAEVLGHNSAATTKKYTKVDNKDRENASLMLSNYMKASV